MSLHPDLLAHTCMTDAKPVTRPLTAPTLDLHSGTTLSDPSKYRTIVDGLQYMLFTWPDIAYAVNKLSQFMHRPTRDCGIFVEPLLMFFSSIKNLLYHYMLFLMLIRQVTRMTILLRVLV